MPPQICKISTIALMLWVGAASPSMGEPQSHYALAQNAIDGYVVPRLAGFERASGALADTIKSYCVSPSATGREDVTRRFRGAVLAWAEAEIVRVGPGVREGRAQKIAFWPDPRGAVERQLRQALAHKDPALTDAQLLGAQSAAVQGFPALEFLLADHAADIGAGDEEGKYRCRVASAIAGNVAGLAHEIDDGWTRPGGWRDHMLRPGSDNADYPSATAAATDMFKALTTSLQVIIEAEIRPLAGLDGDKKAKPSALPYRRLGLSRDYLIAGVGGCQALYAAANLKSYLDASDPEQAKLAALIDSSFAVVQREAATMSTDGKDTANEAVLRPARVAHSMLAGARRVIATKVAEGAEISLGFNELDGD